MDECERSFTHLVMSSTRMRADITFAGHFAYHTYARALDGLRGAYQ
jgi:hypothetical protein